MGRWLLAWLASSRTPEVTEVRRAMLLTLRETGQLTVMALWWTQAVALSVWWLTGAGWALVWSIGDLGFFVLRRVLSHRIDRAEAAQRRLPAGPMLLTHAAWILGIALGTLGTVSQSDLRLVLLGTMLPVGFSGYVVSRWQAFPRCALAFTYLLWAALGTGLWLSPLAGAALVGALTPAGAIAFHMLLRLNHDILVSALRAQQENRRLSMHDPLTGLPNRLMLRERMAVLCGQLPSGGEARRFAVMCLDLDGFKEVNDRHGHAAGDWLLKSVAERLREVLRNEDLVCRVGGDEFVILLPGVGEHLAGEIAQRVLHALAAPHDLGSLVEVQVGVSIGMALAPAHGETADGLLAAADGALYGAKRAGKGVWHLHGDRNGQAQQPGPLAVPRP